MPSERQIIALIAVVAVISLVAIGMDLLTPPQQKLLLATTTSVKDTGLMDSLVEDFTVWAGAARGVRVNVDYVGVGTGAALRMGERGDVDAVLVHAPPSEREMVSKGFVVCRQPVAYNFFVLVGPRQDPAHARGLGLPDAFKNIFDSARVDTTVFASRGDDSGTHQKEQSFWKAIGIDYDRLVAEHGGSWYLESGKGMGDTLLIANQKQAYSLTDIGTWLAFRSRLPSLDLLIDRSPDGINVYSVMIVNPEMHQKVNYPVAKLFVEYVASGEGQRVIGDLGVTQYGTPLFQRFDTLDLGSDDPVAEWIFENAVFDSSCPQANGLGGTLNVTIAQPLQAQSPDLEVLGIVVRSLYVAVAATALASLWSMPASILLAFSKFRYKGGIELAFETMMSVPTVVVGLLFYLLLVRSGPLGSLNLLYTNEGIIIASSVLITPILISLATATLKSVGKEIRESVLTLGGNAWRAGLEVLHEARVPIAVSILVAFTRAIGELGVAFMVGGDIRFNTRLLSTAVAFETSRGNWEFAMILSLILLILVMAMTAIYIRVVKHGVGR